MAYVKGYQEFVLDDLKKYAGLTRPLKAGMLERMLVKKAWLNQLHPNPKDEFSIPEIGPNDEIVQNYVRQFNPVQSPYAHRAPEIPDIEPLIVEKMKPRGYMILNGHHRWLAACRVRMKTIPVRIVNITHENEILEVMNRTKNRVCASFDLDEVILAAEGAVNIEPKPSRLTAALYRDKIREGVPALMDALRLLGCDLWVYTGQYRSESSIRRLLRLYGVTVDGIVNGMKNRKSTDRITQHFKERYDASIHVDAEEIICVDTKNHTYDTVEMTSGASAWASEAIVAIRGMETVQKALAKDKE